MSDWKRLGDELIACGPRWINERNRQAFEEAFKEGIKAFDGYMFATSLSHLAELGETFESRIRWEEVKKLAKALPKKDV